MNVLFFATDFAPDPGGVAVFVHSLAVELAGLGHRVDVLAPAVNGAARHDAAQPYTVHRYTTSSRLSSLTPIRHTLALHRRQPYDVVLFGHILSTPALGALLLRTLRGVPYVFLSHGNDLRYHISTRLDAWVTRWLLANAALMLANSQFTAQAIRQAGYTGRVEILNPGVDVTLFDPHVDPEPIRQELGLNGHRVLLTTARLVAKKNVDAVLRALPRVIAQVPNLLYVVAGDGEERGRLEALCDQLDLRAHVRFVGHVEHGQLPALYNASDLYVMPSYTAQGDMETFGISFVEANACLLPVIGGRSGGIGDAVLDGETGLLVDPHDDGEIAAAMIRLLTDRDLARKMAETGRWRAEQSLSWKKVGERLETYLGSITAQLVVGAKRSEPRPRVV